MSILLGLRCGSETQADLDSVFLALYIELKKQQMCLEPSNPTKLDFLSVLLVCISVLLLIFICCLESENT